MQEQQLTSSYFSSLSYNAKKRYLEKFNKSGFNLKDPFSIENGQWSENLSQWPELKFGDIYGYLIDTEGTYTKEKLKV